MFRSLRSSKLPTDHVFAVNVGVTAKKTAASWHLVEPSDVVSAIAMLNEPAGAGTMNDELPDARS